MFSEKKYRRDIQVFRGLAVLAVVLFHAKDTFFPLGYLGVDVFFVISGFVVTPLILRIFADQHDGRGRLSNLRDFYKRRIYRLAPALAVTLAIAAILIFLLGPVEDHQRFAQQGIATLLLIGNIGAYNYAGDYFSPNINPLIHTWSLSIEEQIYIFLPILLMLLLHKRRSLKKIATVSLGVITAISFFSFLFPVVLQPLYSRAGLDLASQISFYSPFDRVWQFTLGGLAFLLVDRYQNRINRIPRSFSAIALIASIVVLFGPMHIDTKVGSIFTSFCAVIVIIFKSLDALPSILAKHLEWLGDRSYSIYLVHMPLIYIAKCSAITAGEGRNRIIPTIFAVFSSIILGAVSYSKIENRYRISKVDRLPSNRRTLLSLLLAFILPFSLFAGIYKAPYYDYWGLNIKYPQTSSATTVISKCDENLTILINICSNWQIGATNSAVLIGDSHAEHFSVALTNAAKHSNWNLIYWKMPLVTTDKVTHRNFIDWIKGTRPDLLIISQYWRSESEQDVIKSRILELKGYVKNVLFLENNPIFPDVDRFRLSGYLIAPFEFPKSYPISKMDFRDEDASDELSAWARDNDILTMNFDSLFCDSKKCSRYSEDGWLYTDVNHLSLVGANLAYPLFSVLLKSFEPTS